MESVGCRCEALTIKEIHGGTGFGAGTGSGASFRIRGNQHREGPSIVCGAFLGVF